jgi:hypothetical protein
MNAPANFSMNRSDQLNELAKALAQAQGLFTSAEREHVAKVASSKGEGSSYSYNYADLAAYLDVCRDPLAKCGLSFVQSTACDQGQVSVATMLLHSSGQWIEFPPLTLHAADARPQTIGSAITYARRYSLSAALGMASEADDDANSANGNQATTAPRKQLPICPECHKPGSTIIGKAEYGGGLVCYKDGCKHKWETAEYPFNENHKGNGKAKKAEPADDGPFTSSEGSLFDSLHDAARAVKDGKALGIFLTKAMKAYHEKQITAAQFATLTGSTVANIQTDKGLNWLGKWIADTRVGMSTEDAKCFDDDESLIQAKVEQLQGAGV